MTRRRRDLRPDELLIWSEVVRTVAPFPGRLSPVVAPPVVPAASDAKPEKQAAVRPGPPPAALRPRLPGPVMPIPGTIDRRTARALARDKVEIGASLDLHGLTQAEAHLRLLAFLRHAQRCDHRFVRVITGHGLAGTSADRGVLRRMVPLWLTLPLFTPVVSGFGPAGPRQGGPGAIHVRLKRLPDR